MKSRNHPPEDQQELEQFIGTVLRRQPLRQAPATLEARVLRELTERAARPWWLQGFGRWPWSARILFLPVSLAFVQLSLLATDRVASLWNAIQGSTPVGTVRSGLGLFENLAQALQTLGNMLTHGIPQAWIYGGAGVALLLYAAMFGLGAAAFRTLLEAPEPLRYPS
jgi:hypothetical protein